MFKLSPEFVGIFSSEELQNFFEAVPDNMQVVRLLNAAIGEYQLLHCQDVGVYFSDGVPMFRVGKIAAWIAGRLVFGEDLTLDLVDTRACSIMLLADDEQEDPLGNDSNLSRSIMQPKLAFKELKELPTNGIEIARLCLSERDVVEVDPAWWPNLIRIEHDGRSLAALEAVRNYLKRVSDVSNRLQYVLANGSRNGWHEVLPELFELTEKLQLINPPIPVDVLQNDSMSVAWVLRQLENLLDFPSQLKQVDRTLEFCFSLEPTKSAEIDQIVFERPPEVGPTSWLAVIVDRLPDKNDLRLMVSPGQASVLVPSQRATLIKQWGGNDRILLNASGIGCLKGAVYA